MTEPTPRGPSEPASTRPGRPATHGMIRCLLQQLFPDLDPDVVSEVLDLTMDDEDGEK
ncbi:MAG TPA: CUE domain-containing protein [Kineosporiaceae bacterium]